MPRRVHRNPHHEHHNLEKRGWLRAAVLGANDGIVSVAALVIGVVAADVATHTVFIAGMSALIAGAFSMAVGEYVSVSSQKDIERANIAKEKQELEEEPKSELAELAGIYMHRGLSKDLAHQVAVELTEHNALQAHMRDELGIIEEDRARPLQAAYVSFIAFSLGALLPIVMSALGNQIFSNTVLGRLILIGAVTIIAMVLLGYFGAYISGAPAHRSVTRTVVGGTIALVVTALIGTLLG
jgi:VIT1/CCC1 family predicted Fe2+/Mn2+ transporter